VIETFVCNDILDVYHKLYLIEEQIRNASMDIRLAMRRRFSKPLAKELRMKLVALPTWGEFPILDFRIKKRRRL
jgi:hypothetical protein